MIIDRLIYNLSYIIFKLFYMNELNEYQLLENVYNIGDDVDSLLIYLRLGDSSDASLGRMAAKFEIQDLYLHNYLLIKDNSKFF